MKHNCMKIVTVSLATMLLLTGCGNKIPDMTEEQAQQIGEYAAITLLKYDANNRSRLVDASEIEAHDEKEKRLQELLALREQKKEPEGMKPADDTPVIEVGESATTVSAMSFDEFYELPAGVTITYQNQEICSSYTGDASENGFVLDADAGKRLLVLKFVLENQSGSEQRIDLFSKTASYKVATDDSQSISTLTTMLMDDMSTYVGKISAGESKTLVLLSEIDETKSNSIVATSLSLKDDAKIGTIQLQ